MKEGVKAVKLTAKILIIRILDLIGAFLLFPFVIICVLQAIYWRFKKRDEKGSLLHLSSGASTNDVLNKFSSLDFLFNYDGDATEGLFQKNILFWFPSRNSLCLHFSNGWIILEQRMVFGILLITGIFLYLIRLIRIIQVENVKVIRGWDPYFNGFMAWLISSLCGLPFCVSIHADYDLRYKLDGAKVVPVFFGSRRLAKILERFVLSHTKMVMPIRESLGRKAVEDGAKPESIRIIPHGIDMTPFSKKPDIDFKKKIGVEGKKLVVFVGRLSQDNYVYDILKIAEKIKEIRSDTLFLMVGGGVKEDKIKEKVKEEGLDNLVKFFGFQPWKTVVDFRQNADVNLCLMAGFSLIEAAASGRPIVAYDVEWHYELVKDGQTGFLIKEGDVQAAAEKINYLLNNPNEADRMGETAKQLAFERHSIEKTSAIKRRWYNGLLRSGSYE